MRLALTLTLAFVVMLFTRLSCASPLVASGYAVNYYQSGIDSSYQPYGVYIPHPYDPEHPHPVVLHMHGFGGRLGGFSPWQTDWADSHGWILVYPDDRGSNNYDGIGEDDLFSVLADLKERYNIDADRVYVTGGSMGGHGSYRMPLRFPHIFTAGAPIAGWTDFREFYAHFYEQADEPRLPDYIDPSRRPLLETASTLWQTENAKYNWLLIGYGTWDPINPPSNAEQVVQRLREFGYQRYQARGDWGGHGAGYDLEEIYNYFEGKSREHQPKAPVYVTNTLKYNRGYWLQIDHLCVSNQWARLAAKVDGNTVQIEATNVRGYTLLPEDNPLDLNQSVTVYTNGVLTYQGIPGGALHIAARMEERYRIVGWDVAPPASAPQTGKRHGLQGPIGDVFLSRFVVSYGTAGTRAETERNREDALRFCAEWNNWMCLHWGGDKLPAKRRADWWVPPYPFRSGAYIPANQPLVLPVKDSLVTPEMIANANLILFGDARSHSLIHRLRDQLPLTLTDSGVSAGNRAYTGPNIRYVFIAPNPLNPERYVVVSKGYLSSRIDPASNSPSQVGKDLEAIPFFWPDYVIWDSARQPAPTVQAPFVYLPETYLEAGYFDDAWKLDDDPPGTSAFVQGDAVDGAYRSPVDIALVAADHPGGFGVAVTEYRLDGGFWMPYTKPISVTQPGDHLLEYRSVDRCGRFLYEDRGGHTRGRDAEGNTEPTRTLSLRIQSAGTRSE